MIKLKHPESIKKELRQYKKVGMADDEVENAMEYIKDIHSDKLCDDHIHLTYIFYTDGLFTYEEFMEDMIMYSDNFDEKIKDCLEKKDFVYVFADIIRIDKKLLKKTMKYNPETNNEKTLRQKLNSFKNPTDFFTFFGSKAFDDDSLDYGWFHANMIIINSKLRTAEHFEPHGAILYDVRGMEDILKEKFLRTFGITYYRMLDICPHIIKGPQLLMLNDPGFCASWSIWFLDMRLLNLDVDRTLLYKGLMNKLSSLSQEDIESFITEYWYTLKKYHKLRKEKGLSREVSMQKLYKGKGRAYYDLEVSVDMSNNKRKNFKRSSRSQFIQDQDDNKTISDVDQDDDETIPDVDQDDDIDLNDDYEERDKKRTKFYFF